MPQKQRTKDKRTAWSWTASDESIKEQLTFPLLGQQISDVNLTALDENSDEHLIKPSEIIQTITIQLAFPSKSVFGASATSVGATSVELGEAHAACFSRFFFWPESCRDQEKTGRLEKPKGIGNIWFYFFIQSKNWRRMRKMIMAFFSGLELALHQTKSATTFQGPGCAARTLNLILDGLKHVDQRGSIMLVCLLKRLNSSALALVVSFDFNIWFSISSHVFQPRWAQGYMSRSENMSTGYW